MKVFLDTNVWVSAFAAPGLCEELVRELLTSASDEVLSTALVWAELEAVLARKLRLGASVIASIQGLYAMARCVPDADASAGDADARLVAAALAAGSDLFITGDKGLIERHATEGLRIATPRQAWLVMKARP